MKDKAIKERIKQARKISIDLSKETNGDDKAEIWICSNLRPGYDPKEILPGFRISKCHRCKGPITYDPKVRHLMTKDAKKICKICINKFHLEYIDPKYKEYITGGFN
jgi:hypothetical protein